jgi:hypothetical protein
MARQWTIAPVPPAIGGMPTNANLRWFRSGRKVGATLAPIPHIVPPAAQETEIKITRPPPRQRERQRCDNVGVIIKEIDDDGVAIIAAAVIAAQPEFGRAHLDRWFVLQRENVPVPHDCLATASSALIAYPFHSGLF